MHGEVNRSLGIIERSEAIDVEISSCFDGCQSSLHRCIMSNFVSLYMLFRE